MRELTKEEQEMLREEKVTMAKLAREELQAFLDSGLPACALGTYGYAVDYACLQYRSAARRWFRDADKKETVRIIFKNRKVFAERMDHGDGK